MAKNDNRAKFAGKKITRKQALRGLGDPKTWKAQAEAVNAEFKRKPSEQK
jgi:hypothetical protein